MSYKNIAAVQLAEYEVNSGIDRKRNESAFNKLLSTADAVELMSSELDCESIELAFGYDHAEFRIVLITVAASESFHPNFFVMCKDADEVSMKNNDGRVELRITINNLWAK